jgi:elongation factor G
MIEAVAECHDAVLEKFVEGEEISKEEIMMAIRQGALDMKITPVFCGSAFKDKGVQNVLDAIVDYLPCPIDRPPLEGFNPETAAKEVVARPLLPDQPFAGLVFKTISDPNGDLTFIRVYTGEMTAGRALLQRPHAPLRAHRSPDAHARRPARADRDRARR